jgi:hypothetical protein
VATSFGVVASCRLGFSLTAFPRAVRLKPNLQERESNDAARWEVRR